MTGLGFHQPIEVKREGERVRRVASEFNQLVIRFQELADWVMKPIASS